LWEDENIADSITVHARAVHRRKQRQAVFSLFRDERCSCSALSPSAILGQTDMGLRGDAIVQFDWSVGEIVKALEKAGIRENTLIIVTSDNGPVVDDGYADQAVEKLKNHKPWGPFRGGKYSAYEAGTRVPFIVNWQGRTQAKESTALVSQIDMLATLGAFGWFGYFRKGSCGQPGSARCLVGT